MIRLSAASLAALRLGPRILRAEGKSLGGDFSFIAVNDLHFSNADCEPWFNKVVDDMKRSVPKAEFCLLGGDLADTGTPAQLSAIKEAFGKLGVPVYAVPGNHDYLTDSDREAYERIFPNQINYHFKHRGWQIIGLDTSEGTKSNHTSVSDITLDWLDQNIPKLDRHMPAIIFTHFPLSVFVFACPINSAAVLRRCAGLNLQAIFSGHFHGYTENRFADAIMTTDRCCSRIRGNHDGTLAKGWFHCETMGGQLKRTFVEFQLPA